VRPVHGQAANELRNELGEEIVVDLQWLADLDPRALVHDADAVGHGYRLMSRPWSEFIIVHQMMPTAMGVTSIENSTTVRREEKAWKPTL